METEFDAPPSIGETARGHVEVTGRDPKTSSITGTKLTFKMELDQTYLPRYKKAQSASPTYTP